MMNVSVIGTGYVGLVAGACLSELGHRVVCADTNEDKISILNNGGLPIYEPGLEAMVPRNVAAGRLRFTTDLEFAMRAAEVIFIAVGTPPREDGSADISYVLEAARSIATFMDGPKIIAVKSTVPIGTCRRVKELISGLTEERFEVVSNPEFLREGVAVRDFLQPDRVVMGTESEWAEKVMARLYRPLTSRGAKLLNMDLNSSEMTKYASNAMLATRISFINEIARLCHAVGADVENVRRGMGSDSRIGPHFLQAGVGYGGSCFPKDIDALIDTAKANQVELRVLDAVTEANKIQKLLLSEMVKEIFGEDLSGLRFALWGLAFKPDTDDMREAPSISIARELCDAGGEVVGFDPEANLTAPPMLGDTLRLASGHYEALEGADALLLVTEWKLFTSPNWGRVLEMLRQPHILDGRNLWNPSELRGLGFTYRGIGRR